jgi:hypothetical protein
MQLVTVDRNGVRLNIGSVAEAKQALKELKLKKKELSLLRKQVVAQQQALRAEHTDKVRTQGSMLRGGGGLGKFIRNVQRASRDADKRQLANALRPLEMQKQSLDSLITAVEQAILKVEAYIVQNS